MAEHAIAVEGLSAGYGGTPVLHDVSFNVSTGTWAVLIGPNGSGKSTLIKTLIGMLVPYAGHARVLGRDAFDDRHEVRRCCGYAAEETYLYKDLSVMHHCRFAAAMYGVPEDAMKERIHNLAEHFELTDMLARPVAQCSLGMRRKLGLCMAMIHRPRVLLLDEPLNGLDPIATRDTRQLLRQWCDEDQVTILMSTHNLSMMHDYCDQLLIMHGGRILVSSSPASLFDTYKGDSIEEILVRLVRAAPADPKAPNAIDAMTTGSE